MDNKTYYISNLQEEARAIRASFKTKDCCLDYLRSCRDMIISIYDNTKTAYKKDKCFPDIDLIIREVEAED